MLQEGTEYVVQIKSDSPHCKDIMLIIHITDLRGALPQCKESLPSESEKWLFLI
jgi:hypothetical protein